MAKALDFPRHRRAQAFHSNAPRTGDAARNNDLRKRPVSVPFSAAPLRSQAQKTGNLDQSPCKILVSGLRKEARWQNGYVADCKSVYAGSIPARASKVIILPPRCQANEARDGRPCSKSVKLASPIGFEPTAPSLGNLCSIQLSYGDTSRFWAAS